MNHDFTFQSDEEEIKTLLQTTQEKSDKEVYANYEYLWRWQVPHVEASMAFRDGGNVSKSLEFLLFCNGNETRGFTLVTRGRFF